VPAIEAGIGNGQAGTCRFLLPSEIRCGDELAPLLSALGEAENRQDRRVAELAIGWISQQSTTISARWTANAAASEDPTGPMAQQKRAQIESNAPRDPIDTQPQTTRLISRIPQGDRGRDADQRSMRSASLRPFGSESDLEPDGTSADWASRAPPALTKALGQRAHFSLFFSFLSFGTM